MAINLDQGTNRTVGLSDLTPTELVVYPLMGGTIGLGLLNGIHQLTESAPMTASCCLIALSLGFLGFSRVKQMHRKAVLTIREAMNPPSIGPVYRELNAPTNYRSQQHIGG